MEQDGRGVGGLEVHLLHEYIRNTPSDIEVHGKQEYLTTRKEYIDPRKTRDQALSLWSGSTDSKTLDYQRTNPAAAAAAAKSLQSCPTLCDPIDGSPAGSRIP